MIVSNYSRKRYVIPAVVALLYISIGAYAFHPLIHNHHPVAHRYDTSHNDHNGFTRDAFDTWYRAANQLSSHGTHNNCQQPYERTSPDFVNYQPIDQESTDRQGNRSCLICDYLASYSALALTILKITPPSQTVFQPFVVFCPQASRAEGQACFIRGPPVINHLPS